MVQVTRAEVVARISGSRRSCVKPPASQAPVPCNFQLLACFRIRLLKSGLSPSSRARQPTIFYHPEFEVVDDYLMVSLECICSLQSCNSTALSADLLTHNPKRTPESQPAHRRDWRSFIGLRQQGHGRRLYCTVTRQSQRKKGVLIGQSQGLYI